MIRVERRRSEELEDALQGVQENAADRAQELLFPRRNAFGFGAEEAALAADLYRRLPRPRNRAVDLAIAACAISNGAALWTTNPRDFADIPGLTLADG